MWDRNWHRKYWWVGNEVCCHLILLLLYADWGVPFVGPAEAIALGFQHYLVVLGSSVMIPSILVPMMGGTDVSFVLICIHHSHVLQALVLCYNNLYRPYLFCLLPYTSRICKVEFSVHMQIMCMMKWGSSIWSFEDNLKFLWIDKVHWQSHKTTAYDPPLNSGHCWNYEG